jgi:photosystem II stability/assembly factor-like uncharacterized protein
MNNGFEGGLGYSVQEYDGAYYFATHGGIYYTEDNFESYGKISINGNLPRVTALLIHNDIFFAGTRKEVFKSTDFGQSWQSLSDELPSKWVNDIKTDGTNIFVALSGNGVYCSSDNGVTWQPKNNGIEESYPGMILIDGENLFQIDDYEIYFSDDYGETWFKTLDAPEFVNDIIRSEDKILAGNADGIYEYIFETNSWVLMADDSEMLLYQ